MAEILVFPLTRRVAFVERHARRALQLKPEAGARHVLRMVSEQKHALLRKQVPEAIADEQARDLEAAIRAAMWAITWGIAR